MYKSLDSSNKSHLSIQLCINNQGKDRNKNQGDSSSKDPPPRKGIQGVQAAETTLQDASRQA